MEKKIFQMAGIGIVSFLFVFGNLVAQSDTTTQFGVYSNFTFVPGNKLLFYDDFAQEQIGDFPQFGLYSGRLSTSGKGETEPVDDNNTLQGKANNRRVEIIKK